MMVCIVLGFPFAYRLFCERERNHIVVLTALTSPSPPFLNVLSLLAQAAFIRGSVERNSRIQRRRTSSTWSRGLVFAAAAAV